MAKVLVADDSRLAREIMKTFLDDLGHEVVYAAINGKEAYTKYMELKPDIITLDVNMPEMDGLSVARNILRQNINAKIIIITSLDEEKIRSSLLAEGSTEYIRKPIDIEMLMDALKNLGY